VHAKCQRPPGARGARHRRPAERTGQCRDAARGARSASASGRSGADGGASWRSCGCTRRTASARASGTAGSTSSTSGWARSWPSTSTPSRPRVVPPTAPSGWCSRRRSRPRCGAGCRRSLRSWRGRR
jgi:hypothetical protein